MPAHSGLLSSPRVRMEPHGSALRFDQGVFIFPRISLAELALPINSALGRQLLRLLSLLPRSDISDQSAPVEGCPAPSAPEPPSPTEKLPALSALDPGHSKQSVLSQLRADIGAAPSAVEHNPFRVAVAGPTSASWSCDLPWGSISGRIKTQLRSLGPSFTHAVNPPLSECSPSMVGVFSLDLDALPAPDHPDLSDEQRAAIAQQLVQDIQMIATSALRCGRFIIFFCAWGPWLDHVGPGLASAGLPAPQPLSLRPRA